MPPPMLPHRHREQQCSAAANDGRTAVRHRDESLLGEFRPLPHPNGGQDQDDDDLAFWPTFGQKGFVQELVPGPKPPFPISNFSTEHNCGALTALGLIK